MIRSTLAPILCLFLAWSAYAEEEGVDGSSDETDDGQFDEAALDEDPEARRRSKARIAKESADKAAAAGLAPPPDDGEKSGLEAYSSLRVHWINTVNDNGKSIDRASVGNSHLGLRGDWQYRPGWSLMGRFEAGFDLASRYSSRGSSSGEGGVTGRLMFAGVESDNLALVFGRNWSAFYEVAGMTDRFEVFGGSASGIYSAGTVGDATGTGRADDIIQARIYIDKKEWGGALKPFNLNLQYQFDQGIPAVDGERYEYGYAASVSLETQKEFSLGLAYSRSHVQDPQRPAVVAAGINGDATALAISTRAYGDRWYASVLYSRLKNMEITDRGMYYDARGIEVYAQWEVKDDWWLIGGGNWLEPSSEDPDAGLVRTKYYVLGGRYAFDSFNRMLYFEYRIDKGRLFDGTPGKDEFAFGVRWDFDH